MRALDSAWCVVVGLAMGMVGCRPPTGPEAWQQARAACGLHEDEHPSTVLVDGEIPTTLSQDCATWLAEDLGVEWEGFGAAPGPVTTGQDPLSITLLGAWALVASDYGMVGPLLRDPEGARWGQQALGELAREGAFQDDDDAGALLYAYVLDHVDRVAYDPDLQNAGARFHNGTVTVPPMDDPWDAPPAWMASVLVHEAGHHRGPSHVRCADSEAEDCDPDLHAIYGTQAQALATHAATLDPADPLTPDACAQARFYVDTICRMVNAPARPGLCDEALISPTCPAS